MIALRFVAADGRVTEAEGLSGQRLLDVAQAAGQALEGTCGGDMACATCHVILDPATFAAVPPASVEEEDMLDLAPDATRHSRLACQLRLGPALAGASIRIVPS